MRLVLLLASAVTVIGTAAPAYADPDGKDQTFLNALSQAGLTYLNADRAINAGKQVCSLADDMYRKSSKSKGERDRHISENFSAGLDVGLALKGAALDAGEVGAFKKIAAELRKAEPKIAKALGF